MKKLLIMAGIVSALLFTGCTTVVCRFQKSAIERVSDTISDAMQCTNRAAVFADLQSAVSKLSPCRQAGAMQGPVADFVCPTISKWVTEFIVDKAVPETWGCKASAAKTTIAAQVERVCKLIPVEEQ